MSAEQFALRQPWLLDRQPRQVAMKRTLQTSALGQCRQPFARARCADTVQKVVVAARLKS
jgi:hypothetical protein